jgi:hypothetical protein
MFLYSVQAPGHCAPPREGCTAACVCRSIDGLAAAVQAKGLASGSALPDLVCGNPLLHRVLCPPFRHSLACLVWLTRSCVLSEATNRFHVHWHVGKRHPPLFTPFSCCSPCLVLCLGLVPTAVCHALLRLALPRLHPGIWWRRRPTFARQRTWRTLRATSRPWRPSGSRCAGRRRCAQGGVAEHGLCGGCGYGCQGLVSQVVPACLPACLVACLVPWVRNRWSCEGNDDECARDRGLSCA